jgi:NADH dehydrogenase
VSVELYSARPVVADVAGVAPVDGSVVPTYSLIWCVGLRPDPLADRLGLPTVQDRLAVDEYLNVPGHPEVYACGDAAAVPDLTRPGHITPMTAQHAQRQGKRVAHNIAADWLLNAVLPRQTVQLGLVPPTAVPLDTETPELVHLSRPSGA